MPLYCALILFVETHLRTVQKVDVLFSGCGNLDSLVYNLTQQGRRRPHMFMPSSFSPD
ncbi:hypothetical protein E2C01_087658 [Portunus trituberculatus]|uniref:Uncharacterized protein n=1 Tax=Portunus trituberculatus TaxID=210409 RepID=A0A5B7JDZ0_PORTR|nr:hypothetical protein [Portunus trituberculatus]